MRLLLLLLFLFPTLLLAQGTEKLWVTGTDKGWVIVYTVKKGETAFMLARRFHVPPALLTDLNHMSYADELKENSTVLIPLGAYNRLNTRPVNKGEARPLYYRAGDMEDMQKLARKWGITLPQLQGQNNPDPVAGRPILLGWVMYDATQTGPAAPVAVTRPPDTPRYITVPRQQPPVVDTAVNVAVIPERPVLPPMEALFMEQTSNGQKIVTERGSAAFFPANTKGSGIYAFHNMAARGSVIRVKNMNNGRVVYVKVLGPVPLTKQYYNCILGLSTAAKSALGVRESKAFCELSYAGY